MTLLTRRTRLEAGPTAPRGSSFRVLRNRDFALFWGSALISSSGSFMQAIALPFVIYRMTHSATWLGVTAFAAFIPIPLVAPIAGSIADRFPRKRVLMYTQTAMMTLAFVMWGVWVAGIATPGLITVIALALGTANGLNLPTWQSFVPQLVSREELVDAVRLNSMQFMGARAVGPAVAGLVLEAFGPGAAFLGNALSFLLVLAVLPWIHPRVVVTDATPGRVLAHFKEGLRYVGERQSLVLCMVLATSISAVGTSLVQLAPALAHDEFHVGRGAYGVLVAAFGFGAIIGAVVVAFQADRITRATAVTAGWGIHIVSVLALGLAPSYAVGFGALVGMGASYFLASTSITTSMQARVSELQRGRVLSIYFATMLTGLPLGALVQGKLADVFGLREVVVGSAVVLTGLLFTLRWRFDGLRPLDEPPERDAGR